jgi:hypothetical protein
MGFLAGKRILILGVASKLSIASGIASAMHREGADLAFTYQNDKRLYITDRNDVKTSDKYPPNLDFRGSPTINSVMYPEMVADPNDSLLLSKPKGGFRHSAGIYMQDTNVQDMGQINPHLHGAIVRTTFNLIGEVH